VVSFTIEYKVGIAEFYLYMGFGADLLKNVVTIEPENGRNRNPHTFKIGKILPVCFTNNIGVESTTFLSRMQNLVKIGKELWDVIVRQLICSQTHRRN